MITCFRCQDTIGPFVYVDEDKIKGFLCEECYEKHEAENKLDCSSAAASNCDTQKA